MIYPLSWGGVSALNAITLAIGAAWSLAPATNLSLATVCASVVVSRPRCRLCQHDDVSSIKDKDEQSLIRQIQPEAAGSDLL